MSCQCPPANNISCATQGNDSSDNITFAQPTCVIVSGEMIENNPFYFPDQGMSYWAYKVIVGCNNQENITPLSIYIPIYENIDESSIVVFERLFVCYRFSQVPFDFVQPPGVPPPPGFRYLRIPILGRYTTGISVYYRLQIRGDFPSTPQVLLIEDTGGDILPFVDRFVVPGEPLNPRLVVTKTSNEGVTTQQIETTINYTVEISNVGNTDFIDVDLEDMVTYNSAMISIGEVIVNNGNINIDTSVDGIIRLSGSLGDINQGESVFVRYSIQVLSFLSPGSYFLGSITMANSDDVQSSTNTMLEIEIVEFDTSVSCNRIDDGSGEFIIDVISVPPSPMSNLFSITNVSVPDNCILQFTSFDNCEAFFVGTSDPAILNTDISSSDIEVVCDLLVQENGMVSHRIGFRVVSVDAVDESTNVMATLVDVGLNNQSLNQILLGVNPLPNDVSFSIGSDVECSNACN